MAIIEDNDIELFAPGQQIQFAHTANNVVGVLAVACSASDTTLSLSPGGGALFPNAPFYCSIEFEVLWCLSKSGDSLIVQRGQDGTAAASHVVGVSVEMRNNAGLWTDAYNAINAVSTDVGTLQANVMNKSALPPDTTFAGNTQELTHKTIDLTDPTKSNVIIGNVAPDPTLLPYNNMLTNPGYDYWPGLATTQTIAAGTPTSGSKQAPLTFAWDLYAVNDSSITAARDTGNPDPNAPSGYDLLINATTVQTNDYVELSQTINNGNVLTLNSLVGSGVSVSSRIKQISGSVQVAFRFINTDKNGLQNSDLGPWLPLTAAYATYKRENVVWVNQLDMVGLRFSICFKGVGQIAIDNTMLLIGPSAANYRPTFPSAVPNSMLGSDAPRPNLQPNGGFEVWQITPVTAAPVSFADPWQSYIAAGATGTISRDSTNQESGRYCVSIVAAGTVNAANPVGVTGPLNPNDSLKLRGATLTFSARVKASVANAVRISIWDGITQAYSSYHPGNNAYVTLSATAVIGNNNTVVQPWVTVEAATTVYVDSTTLVLGAVASAYTIQAAYPDSLPNSRLATDTARANLLTNGGFEVWQRGAGPFTANGQFTADRWVISTGTSMSVQRDNPNADQSAGYCAAITYTIGAEPPGNGTFFQSFKIGPEYPQLYGRQVSFSIRVKTSTANIVSAAIGNQAVWTAESTRHSGNGAYQTLTATYTVQSSDTLLAFGVRFYGSANVFVDSAIAVVGSVPADYIQIHPADDLAKCLRYYEALANGVVGTYLAVGHAVTTVGAFFAIPSKVTKAISPTITISAPAHFQCLNAAGGALPMTSLSLTSNPGPASTNSIGFAIAVASGLVVGNASLIQVANGSALITAEANP